LGSPTSVQRAERMANSNFYARPSANDFEVKSKRSARPFDVTGTSRYQNREDGCGQWSRDILTITSQISGHRAVKSKGKKFPDIVQS